MDALPSSEQESAAERRHVLFSTWRSGNQCLRTPINSGFPRKCVAKMADRRRTWRSTKCQNFARNTQTFRHFILQNSIPMMVVRIRESC